MKREIPLFFHFSINVLKGLFMSLGTFSNEILGQFVNSDVVF